MLAPPWAPGGGSAPRRLSRVEETLRRDSCALSKDGRLLAVTTNELSLRVGAVSLDQALLVYDTQTGEVVTEVAEVGGSVSGPVWVDLPDGSQTILAFSDVTGFARPFTGSPDQALPGLEGIVGELSLVALGGGSEGVLVLVQSHAAQQALWSYALPAGPATRLDAAPAAAVWGAGFFPAADSGELVVHMQDAATPPHFVAVDPRTGAVGRTVLAPPSDDGRGPPAGQPFESVTLPGGGNGDDVQAWLATPAVGAGRPWPTIVHTHGGPTAVQLATFQPEAQAWLDLGFAWMSINCTCRYLSSFLSAAVFFVVDTLLTRKCRSPARPRRHRFRKGVGVEYLRAAGGARGG
eukprot:SAG22_NODE_651_length_8155_cov_20.230884_6_plen_350_part_00